MTNKRRHTPASIEDLITAEQYHCFPGTNIMACIMKLQNGHTIMAHSACVHDEDFDAEKGRAAARVKAISKIWDKEAYLESNRQHLLGNTSQGQPCDSDGTEI